MELILGSSSLARRQVLEQLKLSFRCITPNIDESVRSGELVTDYVKRLSIEKAHAVLTQINQPSIIIACDQVAHSNNKIYGKPCNVHEAKAFLTELSGAEIEFICSLTVLHSETKCFYSDYSRTHMQFKTLSAKLIEIYSQQDTILHCAAGFQVEALGPLLLKTFKTEDPTSIFGLPILLLERLMQCHGLNLFDFYC